ncbi:MAG: hypothetical protein OSJ27_08390 [Candidatus Gastranaerophilales bacterium]|nr:hypothetical protein [Candidatus Gastranaerophilales bacterium]
MTQFNKKQVLEKIMPVIENTAMRYNLIPLEVSFEKESGHWFLRIFIYSSDHPVNHSDCEHITRGLGDLLDELIPFKYYLEVSSPGLDRRLKSTKEYVIFKGHDVVIKVKEPIDAGYPKKFNAKLLDFNEGPGLKIITEDTQKEYTINTDNIFSVRLNDMP